MKNKKKVSGILYLIAAAASYMSAFTTLAGNENNLARVFWACVGTVFLCMGASLCFKPKHDSNGKSEENQNEKDTIND